MTGKQMGLCGAPCGVLPPLPGYGRPPPPAPRGGGRRAAGGGLRAPGPGPRALPLTRCGMVTLTVTYWSPRMLGVPHCTAATSNRKQSLKAVHRKSVSSAEFRRFEHGSSHM